MTSPWCSGPPPSTPGGAGGSSRPDWDFSTAGKHDTRRRGTSGHATGVVSLSSALRQPAGGWVTPEAREAQGGPPPGDRLQKWSGEWGADRQGGRAHHQPAASSRQPVGPPAERRVPAVEAQGGVRGLEAHLGVDRPDRGPAAESVSTSSTDYYLSLTQRNRDLLSHLRAPRASSLAWGGVDEAAPFNPGGAQQAAEDGGGVHHRRNGSVRFSEAWSGFVEHRPQLSVSTHSRASMGDGHAALVETAAAGAAAADGDEEQPESPQWVGSPGHDEEQRHEERPSPSAVLEQLARRVEDAEARAHEASQAAEARAMAAEAEAEHLRHAAAAERAEAARLAASLAELQAWSRDTAAQLVELRAATGTLVMQAAAAGMEDAAPLQDAARVHRAEAETEQAQRLAAQALRDAAASAELAAAAKLAEAESRREAAAAVGQLQTARAALHALRQAVRDALHAGSGTPTERLSALHTALGADV
jgi:hypothetical protein